MYLIHNRIRDDGNIQRHASKHNTGSRDGAITVLYSLCSGLNLLVEFSPF
jgi:hypothetical protein